MPHAMEAVRTAGRPQPRRAGRESGHNVRPNPHQDVTDECRSGGGRRRVNAARGQTPPRASPLDVTGDEIDSGRDGQGYLLQPNAAASGAGSEWGKNGRFNPPKYVTDQR
jgi:hypothetical protein